MITVNIVKISYYATLRNCLRWSFSNYILYPNPGGIENRLFRTQWSALDRLPRSISDWQLLLLQFFCSCSLPPKRIKINRKKFFSSFFESTRKREGERGGHAETSLKKIPQNKKWKNEKQKKVEEKARGENTTSEFDLLLHIFAIAPTPIGWPT